LRIHLGWIDWKCNLLVAQLSATAPRARSFPFQKEPTMAKADDNKAKKRKLDEKLDEALKDSFPGSDPVSLTEPAPAKEQDKEKKK
jgi:hypothetical protein